MLLGNIDLSEIMGFALKSRVTRQANVEYLVSVSYQPALSLPFACCSPSRDSGAAASDRCAPTLCKEATEFSCGGSFVLGMFVWSLGRLAIGASALSAIAQVLR